jgi:hypothetical protein
LAADWFYNTHPMASAYRAQCMPKYPVIPGTSIHHRILRNTIHRNSARSNKNSWESIPALFARSGVDD